MSETVEIYIRLLEDVEPTIFPTEATPIGNGLYRVLANEGYDPEFEIWEFIPGTVVRCEERYYTPEPGSIRKPFHYLMAVEKVNVEKL